MPISIRLDTDTENRLTHLSEATGRSKTWYIRRLIEEHLDDLEDTFLAEQAVERLRQGKDRALSSKEFWGGLED